jgi:single-stranded DNA-binding protein
MKLSTISKDGSDRYVLNNAIAVQVNQHITTFIDVTFWGKLAQHVYNYFKKGQRIYIEGELRNKSQEVIIKGEQKLVSTVYIVVNRTEFVEKKDSAVSDGPHMEEEPSAGREDYNDGYNDEYELPSFDYGYGEQ